HTPHRPAHATRFPYTTLFRSVRKDVPPFVKAARNPLSYAGVNSIGLQRRGFSTEQITEIQNIYRVFFQKSKNVTQALDFIENELDRKSTRLNSSHVKIAYAVS